MFLLNHVKSLCFLCAIFFLFSFALDSLSNMNDYPNDCPKAKVAWLMFLTNEERG